MNMGSEANQMIGGVIERLEQDPTLCLEDNFTERMRALDALEFHLPDEDALSAAEQAQLGLLRQKLEAANERLFSRLLASIHANNHDAVKHFFQEVAQQISSRMDDKTDYDELDMLVNGLLDVDLIPEE